MAKIAEDVSVAYDGTVRFGNGNILQWAYGGDGFDKSQCSVVGGKTTFCDVNNIANQLNNDFEMLNM
jgi:DNA-directed RNA polymerase beta' subunit